MTGDLSDYCRQVETYLCRKNEGHLIRIVGPAFEQVCGWAQRGVPLNVAFKGIDRYCERYYSRPRRRPVRIEFCETDILELFDDWRRAVGVSSTVEPASGPGRRQGLASHIDRALTRLTSLRAGDRISSGLAGHVDRAVRELDALKGDAQHARGDRRSAIIARLEEIDARLMRAATDEISGRRASALKGDAEKEIAPFAGRMTADARSAATEAAYTKLVREALGIPTIRFE
ncbi:MAG TPA: hypothetical protein VFO14_13125 [Vicinamibacterales bacterium]|nr:hypothetical protein [Vicinamibacterales bacterium]